MFLKALTLRGGVRSTVCAPDIRRELTGGKSSGREYGHPVRPLAGNEDQCEHEIKFTDKSALTKLVTNRILTAIEKQIQSGIRARL